MFQACGIKIDLGNYYSRELITESGSYVPSGTLAWKTSTGVYCDNSKSKKILQTIYI